MLGPIRERDNHFLLSYSLCRASIKILHTFAHTCTHTQARTHVHIRAYPSPGFESAIALIQLCSVRSFLRGIHSKLEQVAVN